MKNKSDIYRLSLNNIGKKIPKNYDTLIIPEIEKITKYIQGDIIKNKIYNYIIYYYNKDIFEGFLNTIYLYTLQGNRKVYYKISKNKITLQLKAV